MPLKIPDVWGVDSISDLPPYYVLQPRDPRYQRIPEIFTTYNDAEEFLKGMYARWVSEGITEHPEKFYKIKRIV